MPQNKYLPEGMLIDSEENKSYVSGENGMARAMAEGTIVEGIATMCDSGHNLIVDIEGKRGIIPRNETAIGIESGKTRDIAVISRVGKPVCFTVTGKDGDTYILSRKAAQVIALENILENIPEGEVLCGRITHLEPFGAFVDMGCGNISLIGIENISVSRIGHPADRFSVGQDIYMAVLSKDRDMGRVTFTHRELLGTWQENAARVSPGQTTIGVVRGIEEYGAFIELTPNLSGLAEMREDIAVGDLVSVYIKSVIPERMKVKLIIIDLIPKRDMGKVKPEDYFITSGQIRQWIYSPPSCRGKYIATHFE